MRLAGKFIQGEVKTITPVGATGHLRGGIKSTTFRQGEAIITEVAPDKEYAPYVEYGTTAPRRSPPFEPLLYWVQRRLGKAGKEAISITHAIQRKIAMFGTAARKMFGITAAKSENSSKVTRMIESGIKRYLEQS